MRREIKLSTRLLIIRLRSCIAPLIVVPRTVYNQQWNTKALDSLRENLFIDCFKLLRSCTFSMICHLTTPNLVSGSREAEYWLLHHPDQHHRNLQAVHDPHPPAGTIYSPLAGRQKRDPLREPSREPGQSPDKKPQAPTEMAVGRCKETGPSTSVCIL